MKRLLVYVALIVVLSYWGYSWWSDRVARTQKAAAEERELASIGRQILAIAAESNAVRDWAEPLVPNGETSRQNAVLSAELEKVWLVDRPILFVGNVRDIATNADGTQQVTAELGLGTRPWFFLATDIRVSFSCPAAEADDLLRAAVENRSYGGVRGADIAMTGLVEEVVRSTEYLPDGDRMSVLTGVGKCLRAMPLPGIFWPIPAA